MQLPRIYCPFLYHWSRERSSGGKERQTGPSVGSAAERLWSIPLLSHLLSRISIGAGKQTRQANFARWNTRCRAQCGSCHLHNYQVCYFRLHSQHRQDSNLNIKMCKGNKLFGEWGETLFNEIKKIILQSILQGKQQMLPHA